MTEQERPRTAEGQALIRDLMAWEPGAVESYRLEARILAIEAEGRQQAVREIRDEAATDIECDCGHGLQAHYGTSEGDRLPQPCSVNDCNCDDFVETERDASESGQPPEASDE